MSTVSTDVWSFITVTTDSPLDEGSANQGAPSFSPDPVSRETVDLMTDILSCHVNPIIGAFGIMGNMLNVIVFLMQKRRQPMNSLLVVLAVVDACFLVFGNLSLVSCYIRHYDPIAARNFTILTLPHVLWIGITLSRISSVLTVVIAVERYLVVMMPLKVKMLVTPFIIQVTTGLACVIPAVAHIPVFLRGEVQWLEHARLNTTLPYLRLTEFARNNAKFLDLYKNLVLNVLFRYVIMGVISVCTGLTIAQLKRYSRWRMSTVTSRSEQALITEKDARVSLTMMRVCALFLVCSVPGCIMLTLRLIQPEFDYYGTYSTSFDLAREINDFFLVINSSANFLIYMRGGDEFRQTFCKMCQKTLPGCCFRFLFRCVMRTDENPVKGMESSTQDDAHKHRVMKKLKLPVTFSPATTRMSSMLSASSVQDSENGAEGQGDRAGEESVKNNYSERKF